MVSQQFDDRIREALAGDDEVQVPGELLARIKSGAAACQNKGFNRKFVFSGFSSRRKLLLSFFGFLVLFILFGMFFEDVRVMAEDVIGRIKTIFVVEKTFFGYKVVEKPADEYKSNVGVSSDTQLSDSELSQKVGYRVSFPVSLNGSFRLHYKALGVTLGKPIGYNLAQQLQSSMIKAIQDDDELQKLNEYEPKRNVFGTYVNNDGLTVFINIERSGGEVDLPKKPSRNKQHKTVTIGDVTGEWVESHMADYPMKTVDGIGGSDMTQKPTAVRTIHYLHWESDGLTYILCFYNGNELSMAEAVKAAESFMVRKQFTLNELINSK